MLYNDQLLLFLAGENWGFQNIFSIPVGTNYPALQTFEKGNVNQFSLNTSLVNFEDAGEPAAAAPEHGAGDGGSAAPKAGAPGKAGAKRAKKIRFELDDERCPTIAEDAGGA